MNYSAIINDLETRYNYLGNQITLQTDKTLLNKLCEQRNTVYEQLLKVRKEQYEAQFELNFDDEY